MKIIERYALLAYSQARIVIDFINISFYSHVPP